MKNHHNNFNERNRNDGYRTGETRRRGGSSRSGIHRRHRNDKNILKNTKLGLFGILGSCFICLFVAIFIATGTGVLSTAHQLLSSMVHSEAQEKNVAPLDVDGEDNNAVDDDPYKQVIDDSTPDPANNDPAPVTNPVFARPETMKSVWLIPGVDYYISADNSGDEIKSQVDSAFAQLKEWGFNSVILPTWRPEKATNNAGEEISVQASLFKNSAGYAGTSLTLADGSELDVLSYITQKAKENDIYAYAVIDFKMHKDSSGNFLDPSKTEDKQKMLTLLKDLLNGYNFDGYLLDGIGYAKGDKTDYAHYMNSNPGGGYENFIYNSVDEAVSKAVRLIKEKDNNLYLGLLSEPVWANETADVRGSKTSISYSTLVDGYADSLKWIESGFFDFVMVKNYYSTLDKTNSFENILGWWNKVCESASIPLYLSHAADSSVRSETGWKSPDQLTKQLIACQGASRWQGSSFYGFSTMKADKSGATKAILNFFKNEIKTDLLFKDLVIVSPEKNEITTEEPTYSLRGNADTNFSITMNGKEIELTELGDFAFDVNLEIGKNTFKFEHKGETITKVINYRFVVLKSITPTKNLTVDGGTRFGVSAIARKGSKVTAKLGNMSITLKEQEASKDENDFTGGSEFQNFYGEFSLPEGKTSGNQNLGAFTISAVAKGVTNALKGASVTIKKTEVVIVDPGEVTPPPTPPNPGDKEPTGYLASGNTVATGRIVEINCTYAETFDKNKSDDISRPQNAYLPQGTRDVIDKNVGSGYYQLGYGNRVYTTKVNIKENSGTLKANSLQSRYAGVTKGTTFMRIGTAWNVPYTVSLKGQNYAGSDDAVSSFTATRVDFTFAYTYAVSGAFDLTGNPLFSSANWVNNGNGTCTLQLTLKTAGGFYGYSAAWNNSTGNLELSFRNPSSTIAGKHIVIDPGHGGSDSGAVGGTSGSYYYEKTATLAYAKVLKAELEKMGASVTLTRDGDYLPGKVSTAKESYIKRKDFARNNGTDFFISLHQDSFTNTSARGTTLFYFNEYSMQAAKSVWNRVDPVYDGYANFNNQRGVKKQNFAVMRIHDCPAILIECAFISNAQDLALIKSDSFRNDMMKAVANGISDYFNALPTPKTATTSAATQTTSAATQAVSQAALAIVSENGIVGKRKFV